MPAGRPRSFDPDQALEKALNVFWRNGYEGASLPDLTKAMGINRPSLYAAFGNKESLFRQAMERYVDVHACHVTQALEAPTAREVVRRMWQGGIDLVAGGSRSPRGCFLVQGALACGSDADPLKRELARRRASSETALRARLERAIGEGDLPPDTDAADLARYACSVMYGMAVQAAGGATRAELERVAELGLEVIPG